MFDLLPECPAGTPAGRPAASRALAPIHLHAGWRSGSTYCWGKFREVAGLRCYYEPFAEHLARATPARIRRRTADSWSSRHPRLDRPYLDEFRPVLSVRGVSGYHEDFALARYFTPAEALDGEVAYLERLAAAARARHERPLFGYSRSLGRVPALRARLGGTHVVLRRHPLQQWLSCRWYRRHEQNPYFELCHFLILALAPAGSPAARVARALGVPSLAPGPLKRRQQALERALGDWTDTDSYAAFLAVHRLGHAAAEASADLVLDMDRLSASAEYRAACADALERATGVRLDFSDCRLPTHASADLAFCPAEIGERIARLLAGAC